MDNIAALFSMVVSLKPKSLTSTSSPKEGSDAGGGSGGGSEGRGSYEGYIKSVYLKSSMTSSVKVDATTMMPSQLHTLAGGPSAPPS